MDFARDRIGLIDQYFMVMIAVAAVLAAASALRFYLVTTIGERVVADVRAAVFDHVTGLSAAFFDKALTGELISRLAADTTQIKSAVGVSVSTALRNLVLFFGSAIMMVVTSPRLSAFVLAVIPVIVIPLVAFGRLVRRRSRTAQDSLADASAYAAELMGAVRTLQAYTSEALAGRRFRAAVERAYRAAVASTQARAMLTAIIIFLVFASVVIILWVGAQDVLAGRTSPGRLGQFVLYAAFAAGGLSQISDVWGNSRRPQALPSALPNCWRSRPRSRRRNIRCRFPTPRRGEVAFDRVRFAYPTRPGVLRARWGFVRRGRGRKGCARRSVRRRQEHHLPFAPALLRSVIRDGVSFDGVPILRADPHDVRAHIALVPQDTVIFAASIADNIRFGQPDATDAEVARAADLAAATEFIARLPQGFETPVGERGLTLSGGQRQRIAIARAILREAPLLLLDEATSSLDAESEKLVQQALARLMQGRTTLVIAHRLATVLKCDRILVMDQGRIVEEGTHESLVAKGGLYARLARLQFEMV